MKKIGEKINTKLKTLLLTQPTKKKEKINIHTKKGENNNQENQGGTLSLYKLSHYSYSQEPKRESSLDPVLH